MNEILDKLKAHKGKAAAVLTALLVVLVGYLSPGARKIVTDAFQAAPVASQVSPAAPVASGGFAAPVESSTASVDTSK